MLCCDDDYGSIDGFDLVVNVESWCFREYFERKVVV